MISANGHLLVGSDCETTGLDPNVDSCWQVAAVPLTYNLTPDKTRPIFDILICPENIDELDQAELKTALRIGHITIDELKEKGLEPHVASDLFDDWFGKLNLPPDKRLIPVGCNWKFDEQFISNWLGFDHYQAHFDGRERDCQTLAIAINDMAEMIGEPIPFSRVSLPVLCKKLSVDPGLSHNALDDSFSSADCYRKLLEMLELC
jgi:DNA polymerase III epsilon subunit-like protein